MLAMALQAEVDDDIRRQGGQDEHGQALVVRNGQARRDPFSCPNLT